MSGAGRIGRLARAILELAEADGQAGTNGVVIASRLTQGERAVMIGTTRESVNKWLALSQRRGLIRHEKGHLTVLRPEELAKRIY